MKFEEIFGNGKFVKCGGGSLSPRFRGKFTAEAGKETVITACGLGFFRLYVNGKRVDDSVFAPVFSYYHDYEGCYCRETFGEKIKSRVYCVEYDVTDLVKPGENTIAAEVGVGWYDEFKGECVLCFKAVSGEAVTVSDCGMKVCDGPVTAFHFHHGENQDYTKPGLADNWFECGFDDSGWSNAVETSIPETEYFIQDCPNDRVIRTIEPKLVGETEDSLIYDAGENITGWYVFKCAEKGRKITVRAAEVLDENGLLNERWIHNQKAEFITDGSDREYHLLYTWHAFRYFEITKGAEVVRVDVIHCDAPVKTEFHSENKVLNWLYDAYIRTQLCNMHAGIPSDCPHLERRGYTGDGQLTCEAVMLMLDTEKFYRKWMEDIADCQDENSGNVQYTAPYYRCGGGPGGWGCAIAEVPYTFYKMFGDIEPMKKYFDGMLRYLDYLEAHSENDLVTTSQPGLWCLGEWCTPHTVHAQKPEIPEPFVNNYFLIRTIDRMTELADKAGRGAEKAALLKKREIKVAALLKAYFDENTGDFAGNINSANAFALDIGLGDERTLANLVNKVRNEKLDTGIFGTDLVAKQLFANGYFDEAVDFLSRTEYPSFGFMMENGATTLWEEWQQPRSMSHPMFGSAVKYLFYNILGIRDAGEAGFDSIVIEPKTNAVTGSVCGSVTLPGGKVSVKVDTEKNECFVSVPDGVKYEVIFDGKITVE